MYVSSVLLIISMVALGKNDVAQIQSGVASDTVLSAAKNRS
jgi:hypothetical protein